MAGDWLKIREDLHEDPAVLRMAAALNTRPEHVVGYCVRFWGWVSRNVSLESGDTCPDSVPNLSPAFVRNVPINSIESALGLPGFLSLLREVDWLEYDESVKPFVIAIPKFERHLSQGAKERALAAEKKRRQRAKNRPDSVPEKSGQVSLKNRDQRREEKRRVNKGINPLKPLRVVFPPTLDTEVFRKAWSDWARHRSEIKHPLKQTQAEKQIAMLAGIGHDAAVAMIEHTVAMGWQGLKAPEPAKTHFASGNGRPALPKIGDLPDDAF